MLLMSQTVLQPWPGNRAGWCHFSDKPETCTPSNLTQVFISIGSHQFLNDDDKFKTMSIIFVSYIYIYILLRNYYYFFRSNCPLGLQQDFREQMNLQKTEAISYLEVPVTFWKLSCLENLLKSVTIETILSGSNVFLCLNIGLSLDCYKIQQKNESKQIEYNYQKKL